MKSDLADIDAILRGQTERAWKIEDEDGNTMWLPKSQVEISNEDAAYGSVVTITLPQWLAEERGLV